TAYLNAQAYYLKQQSELQNHWDTVEFEGANDINALLSRPIDLSQNPALDNPALDNPALDNPALDNPTLDNPTTQSLTVEGTAYQALKNSCRQLGITINVAAQFAWHKLLKTYSQDDQTIVGTTVSGRDIPIEGIESSVGLYINTLPLAVNWCDDSSIVSILKNLHKSIADLNTYSAMPLATLQKDGERLFHSLFVFENYPTPANLTSTGIEQSVSFRHAVEKVDYPLSITAYDQDQTLKMSLSFDESFMSSQQARRLLNQMTLILNAVAQNPSLPHHAIDLLDKNEREQLLVEWNQTTATYPKDQTLQQLFEAQAAKTPDNIALVFDNVELSYRQLNNKANQLAQRIGAQAPDTFIALYFDRSIEMVISILAVLKAGAAYVPISPEYPQGRTDFILKDCGATIVLAQSQYCELLNAFTVIAVNSHELVKSLVLCDTTKNPQPISTGTD
ncbi:MAG: condensation domain-containing protein, partial [Psychrosphaera sp.]|nr:condensation domain-containing protein [Psychrosphaera sp.]